MVVAVVLLPVRVAVLGAVIALDIAEALVDLVRGDRAGLWGAS